MEPTPPDFPEPLAKALGHVQSEVLEGLRHGHFRIEIECELIKGENRRLIVDAGKKHRFVIAPHEIPGAG